MAPFWVSWSLLIYNTPLVLKKYWNVLKAYNRWLRFYMYLTTVAMFIMMRSLSSSYHILFRPSVNLCNELFSCSFSSRQLNICCLAVCSLLKRNCYSKLYMDRVQQYRNVHECHGNTFDGKWIHPAGVTWLALWFHQPCILWGCRKPLLPKETTLINLLIEFNVVRNYVHEPLVENNATCCTTT